VRRAGAAALDLCWVACGRLDGFWEWKLHRVTRASGPLTAVSRFGSRVSSRVTGCFVGPDGQSRSETRDAGRET
jgi:fructose-1,6-bisphosphatase/inositol monophosphatase family enzyme